ncbi:HAD-IA family hydrolase [Streptomyces sp. DSM 44917]|uniref:HAD-IA family hydrolase n=1 Tax=Streptomyces boetiae TaxID=3075541 RepID=A0ABU2LEC3_9ACTN|nr:HAD-IA family hydrolase [Streptomyces sp. DSM 44917]MDT0309921.1 HAD-IA family hydrolase [Streptomyces sp. DSM 44917]
MAITGVLFDFSGTLMRIEPARSWLTAALEATGARLPAQDVDRYAAALEEAGGLPGATPPRAIPPELEELWRDRDKQAAGHRELYTGLARQVPLPDERLYDELYERHRRPAAWHPYPDSLPVLRALAGRGLRVAVVSNIGWDLRPVFRAHGLDELVDAYVLSYEHGTVKPDPALFLAACGALGLAPEQALMVGDDPAKDGGAAALGCAVHLVEHLPVEERPDGLRPVLGLLG